jgi:hypothetical protein
LARKNYQYTWASILVKESLLRKGRLYTGVNIGIVIDFLFNFLENRGILRNGMRKHHSNVRIVISIIISIISDLPHHTELI